LLLLQLLPWIEDATAAATWPEARRSAFHLAKQQPKYERSANDLWQNIIKEVGETHLFV